jgi:lysozyme family protein
MAAANTKFSAKFLRSAPVTAGYEGGYSNHPNDPGGETDLGITQGTLDAWCDAHGQKRRSVKGISSDLAYQVYFDDFWTKAGCERLADGVDLATYDASVNSGVSRGRKWLLASVGQTDVETVKRICAKRLSFMQSLNIWKTFGKGWSKRVAGIEAKAVAWALAAINDNHVVAQQLADEASAAATKAAKQAKGAGGGLVVSGGSGAGKLVTPENADQIAGYILGGLFVVGLIVAGAFVVRNIINMHRADAYAREAGAVT